MNQTIGVNITPQSFQPTLHFSQGDVGRVFVVNVTDYDIPSGATVTCVATKPSGMGFTVSGTVSGNSVTFTSTAEMTDEWGRFPAEIRIASGNTLLGTANFLMIGEKDPHPASTIDGTQEELIPQLTLLVNRVEAAAESVHDLTVSASTLAAGSDATATYDSTNNSIAFGIPRGADGDVTRSEFNDLKSDLNSVKDLEASILPMAWEQGGIDNATGETNNDGSTTRSRDVTYYKVSDLYEVTNPNNYPFYIIFYDFDGNTYTFTHSVAATGTNKDYFFDRTSDQYVRFDIRVGLGYVDTITLKAYSDIVLQIESNTNNIASLSNDMDSITEMSSNRFDANAITDNYYIAKDGTETSSNQYFVTDYIPVSEGEDLYFWGKNDDGDWSNFTKRFRCAYDSSKQPVSSAGTNSESSGNPWTVPSGVAYVRYSIIKANITGWTELYCGLHPVGVDYEAYGKIPKIPQTSDTTYSISNGDSLLEAVKHCYSNNIKNLIVEAGTYDIIDEYEDYYGSDYFDNYTDYSGGNLFDAGIWLQNINVKFSAGAKVVCKYNGENTNVPDYFSAFATGNNVTIDGLVLDAENLRYGIHPDFNTGTDETYFIVKNSDLKHVKATGNQCIGAGLGKHVFWLFENTIFRTVGEYYAMRIHNNVDSSAQSKIIVKDCYIDGDGYFLFNAYSTSTLQTIIQVCGCSYKTAPVVGRETSGSNDNFTMIAWNNELRS